MATLSGNQLHELARKRVDFRAHLIVYFVTNAFLWLIWYFSEEDEYQKLKKQPGGQDQPRD